MLLPLCDPFLAFWKFRSTTAAVTTSQSGANRNVHRNEYLLGVKGADGGDYGLLLVVAQFGVEGKGEDFGSGAFGLGEVSQFVAEVAERGLQVDGDGVVDLAADLLRGEVGAQGVAARGADDVLMEDRRGAWVGVGQDDAV